MRPESVLKHISIAPQTADFRQTNPILRKNRAL